MRRHTSSTTLTRTSMSTTNDPNCGSGQGIASSSSLTYPNPLSYPEPDSSTPSTSSSAPRHVLKDRLYVGNLHPSVDE
jgi:hypothetical protein